MKNNKSKGNRRKQQRRRRERLRTGNVQRQYDLYETIDGNFTYYPVAFCDHYGAFITLGIENVHRCSKRKCNKYILLGDYNERERERLNTKAKTVL